MTNEGFLDDESQEDHRAVQKLTRGVTLGQGARQGAAWLGSSRAVLQVTQFLFSIVTARLLLPSEFGEAALALAIVAFAQLFTDLGLAAAVVHARRATQELLTTAFWLNIGSGLTLALLVVALAYPFSRLYGNDALFPLLAVASLNFAVTRGAVQTALLERTFNFKRLAIIETVSTGTGILVVPIAAIAGLGAMSLVLGPLVGTILLSAGLWASVPWRPSGRPSRRALTQLWRYSSGLVGFNTLTYWSRNVDTLLLGGAVSSTQLGLYNRGFNLMMVPVQQMTYVVGRVLFPSLARLREEPRRMGQAWLRGLEAAGTLAMPITVTFAATAPALVAVLYGPRWSGTAPVLQLLALSAVPQIMTGSGGAVYRALGITGLLFRVGVASTTLSVLAIVIGLRWGVTGVAGALLVSAWVALPIALLPLVRALRLQPAELLAATVGILAPSAAAGLGELAVRLTVPNDSTSATVLIAQLAAGAAAYLLVLWQIDSPALGTLRRAASRVPPALKARLGVGA